MKGDQMKNHRSNAFILGAIVVLILIGLLLVENQTKFVERLVDDIVYDSKVIYLSCSELPSVDEVTRVVEQHKNIIAQIERVHPGYVEVYVNSFYCPETAWIVIDYPSHADRLKIEQIINSEIIDSETFFGIPYELVNN